MFLATLALSVGWRPSPSSSLVHLNTYTVAAAAYTTGAVDWGSGPLSRLRRRFLHAITAMVQRPAKATWYRVSLLYGTPFAHLIALMQMAL